MLFQMLHSLTLGLLFSLLLCAEFSFLRFLNGFGSVVNVTVGDQDFGNIVTYNMSKYVAVPQGE